MIAPSIAQENGADGGQTKGGVKGGHSFVIASEAKQSSAAAPF
jgi:hypothetical protein